MRREPGTEAIYTAPTFKYTLATTGKIGDWMVVTQIRPVSRSDCHWYVGSSTNTATDELPIWILSWTLNTRSNTDWRVSIDIVGTLFIDLSKAFDSTHHQLLLSKLDGAGSRVTFLFYKSLYSSYGAYNSNQVHTQL